MIRVAPRSYRCEINSNSNSAPVCRQFGVGQSLNFIFRAILPARLFGAEGYGTKTGTLATVHLLAMAGAQV
ncbi:hypothetical protein [Shinella zoogloeoides]|uniref:Uncharacterized protein n=1 Tax=Shinella zoogloeoides TaxID=352475 RepID=A0A6N8TK64_SHIZO|nr:hypothetical protein [Shinella zoogloeoides]MXO03051.1 hypothetical protein [Shinella zoogloeoides]UEX81816.1 hypothetical protein K8M09_00410 [Shinella zoogloeoides]